MSTFTDPAKAGELICGAAHEDGPADLPEYGWWPELCAAPQEAQEAEAGS